jgi:uncharacterized protein YoaH (UPF0181 family)
MTKTELREQVSKLKSVRIDKLNSKYKEKSIKVKEQYLSDHPSVRIDLDHYKQAIKTIDKINERFQQMENRLCRSWGLVSTKNIERNIWEFNGSNNENDEYQQLAAEYKLEKANISSEFEKIDELITGLSSGKAFKILSESGIKLEQTKTANIIALNKIELDKSLIF